MVDHFNKRNIDWLSAQIGTLNQLLAGTRQSGDIVGERQFEHRIAELSSELESLKEEWQLQASSSIKFSPMDVKTIRAKLGMSQSEFAAAFGISVSTLRRWERGDCTPRGPALVLLNIAAKEPDVVLRALAS